ncbi:MAG: S-methyl-5-thioribose-1-phosphate isomerase [Candidatus Bathyarchaeota archaeon]|nr:S-methyl-5-thioribose-1-phosphate isomerase [Candidatus Bathyarchaeota archaeon]
MKWINKTSEKIKRLEIQGATNVAHSAVKALTKELLEAKTEHHASTALNEGVKILVDSRETEPMMRNGLKYMQRHIADTWTTREEFRDQVSKVSREILNHFKYARKRIVEIGSRRIDSGDTILTHCHSSAVTATLIRAKENGVDFKVIQLETRPKYQGRITARELVKAGIDTTMIVDSAARHYIKEIDFVVVGSDAITSEGNVINKIGTSQVALAANEARIPFYVVSTLLKFDPETIHGEYEKIEERSTAEVWADPPEGLKIRNPAFDVTRRNYIHGIITETGIISPHSVLEAIHREYPWILK